MARTVIKKQNTVGNPTYSLQQLYNQALLILKQHNVTHLNNDLRVQYKLQGGIVQVLIGLDTEDITSDTYVFANNPESALLMFEASINSKYPKQRFELTHKEVSHA